METNRRATNHNPKTNPNNAPTTEIDRPSFSQPLALHLDYITQSQVSGRHILELWRSKEYQALMDPCMEEAPTWSPCARNLHFNSLLRERNKIYTSIWIWETRETRKRTMPTASQTGAQHLSFSAASFVLANNVNWSQQEAEISPQKAATWFMEPVCEEKASSVEDTPRSNTRLVNQHHVITHSPLLLTLMRLAKETVAPATPLCSTSVVPSETGPLSIRPKTQKSKAQIYEDNFRSASKAKPYLLANLAPRALPEPWMLLERKSDLATASLTWEQEQL